MRRPRTEDKDTTIKDKPQPIDLTEDAADMDEQSEEILQQSGNVEVDEEKLIAPRPDSDRQV
ncbi:MAG: hypothetical protein M3347_05560 [Armatimonadota bacterium]|nr:hypothetical protein [Armatimonadota bacterium]